MTGLPPYDKAKLDTLAERLDKLFATDERDYKAVQALPAALDKVCASLGTWLKQNAVPKAVSYQKTLNVVRAELEQASYRSLDPLLKLVDRAGKLAVKIDKENLNVFIVHGRDESMRDEVRGVLNALHVPSIVLAVRSRD